MTADSGKESGPAEFLSIRKAVVRESLDGIRTATVTTDDKSASWSSKTIVGALAKLDPCDVVERVRRGFCVKVLADDRPVALTFHEITVIKECSSFDGDGVVRVGDHRLRIRLNRA